jgi:Protein of unknown function (DUF3592)
MFMWRIFVIFLAGCVATIWAAATFYTTDVLPQNWVVVKGTVTDYSSIRRLTRTGGFTYTLCPIVAYTTTSGRKETATLDFCSNPAPNPLGDIITISYNPQDPQQIHTQNFEQIVTTNGYASLAGLLGVAGLIGVFIALRRSRQARPVKGA